MSSAAALPRLSTPDLFGYRKYWAHRLTPAPLLPMSRDEMDALGWDQCDVILVTGDAYVDHPSFGMAIVGACSRRKVFASVSSRSPTGVDGRLRAAWHAEPVLRHHGRQHGLDGEPLHRRQARAQRRRVYARRRGRPEAGSQRYCLRAARARSVRRNADRSRRHQASLRRIAHYDYWQEKIRRSILLDSRADLLVFGNGERQIVEIAHRLAAGEKPAQIRNVRGTALLGSAASADWTEIDSTHLDLPAHRNAPESLRDGVRDRRRRARRCGQEPGVNVVRFARRVPTAIASAATSGCRATNRSRTIWRSMHTRRASCTWSRTPATRARSCSGTGRATCG